MKHGISPLKLDQIKTAAKRLKKHLPGKQHMELLDIASHVLIGINSYREAQSLSEKILIKREGNDEGRSLTYGEIFGENPKFKCGDWFFYPSTKSLVFDGEFSPYPIDITRLDSSVKLLDFILQIQKRWSKTQIKGTKVSPTYQVEEFISLIDELCRYYFNDTIQGVYSPFGEAKNVDWANVLLKKDVAIIEEGA